MSKNPYRSGEEAFEPGENMELSNRYKEEYDRQDFVRGWHSAQAEYEQEQERQREASLEFDEGVATLVRHLKDNPDDAQELADILRPFLQ